MIFILLILDIIAVIICIKLGNSKGHPTLGFCMGLFLGWIGVIVMLAVSKTHAQKVWEVMEAQEIADEAHYGPPDVPALLADACPSCHGILPRHFRNCATVKVAS